MSKMGICSCHNKYGVIVNVKHNLCQIGNRDRLDNQTAGKIRLERLNKKDTDLKSTYKELDKNILRCTGCNTTRMLTNSHLIARSARADLISDINNLTKHCITCHPIWESMTRKMMKLNDFWMNLQKIKDMDEEHFNLICLKLELTKEELKEHDFS